VEQKRGLAWNYTDHPKAAKIVLHIYKEMGLHIDYCKDFGITKEEIEATAESQGMRNHPQLERNLTYSSLYCIYQVGIVCIHF
jgi:thiaminase